MSGLINKVKEVLHSDKSDTTHTSTTHNTTGTHTTSTGAPEGTTGHGEYGSSTGGYAHGTGPTHASHDTGLAATTGAGALGSHSSGTREGEHGPHSSRVANAADPRVDSDRDGSHNLGGRTGAQNEYGSSTGGYTHGTGPTHASHDTGLAATTGAGALGSHSSGTREGEYGPHSSRLANAADPRVDSDRDGSHRREGDLGGNPGYSTGTTGYGSSTHSGRHTGTGHHTGGDSGFVAGSNAGTREGEHGPHSSRTANALDPRVDSDRDGSHNIGGNQGYSTGTTGYGSSTHSGTGHHTGHHTSTGHHTGTEHHSGTGHHTGGNSGFVAGSNAGTREGEHGPHSSRTANALDPRVDSDRDGSHNLGGNQGYGTSHNTGATGYGSSTGHNTGVGHNTGAAGYGASTTHTGAAGYGATTGGHNTAGNQGLQTGYGSSTTGHNTAGGLGHNTTGTETGYGSSATGHNTAGGLGQNAPGPAPNTAGPHKSDLVNKLDPRVDSDLDGSKTVGGNKTYQDQQNTSNLAHKDPTDAAQVPPSVLQQHIGAPVIEHDDHQHGRDRRNSSATHQEAHRGI